MPKLRQMNENMQREQRSGLFRQTVFNKMIFIKIKKINQDLLRLSDPNSATHTQIIVCGGWLQK